MKYKTRKLTITKNDLQKLREATALAAFMSRDKRYRNSYARLSEFIAKEILKD